MKPVLPAGVTHVKVGLIVSDRSTAVESVIAGCCTEDARAGRRETHHWQSASLSVKPTI